uniref:non-specific serine/threonine protein kinase n=1 Tax=Cucumis melo TaxID=3656 RepID=A0A9I9EBV2_CUCME
MAGIHGTVLDLATRLAIATDVAHAITYLHMYTDRPIIHRDIKSSNILLTENYRAKVADFGFARLAADGDATHVSTQVKGTAGYLDPEYLKTYQLTEKSDIYSFGVLLVELVTGRRPIEPKRELEQRITPKWAMKKFSEGEASAILDPNLEQTEANHLAVEKILELALQCLAPRRHSRPSMRRCAEILWRIRKDHRDLSAPDFRSFSTNSQRSASISFELKKDLEFLVHNHEYEEQSPLTIIIQGSKEIPKTNFWAISCSVSSTLCEIEKSITSHKLLTLVRQMCENNDSICNTKILTLSTQSKKTKQKQKSISKLNRIAYIESVRVVELVR